METDHQELHQELESERRDMEGRRDELESDTQGARQDFESKISDGSVPGLQGEQEDVLGGPEAVDEAQGDDEDSEGGASAGGGSEGAGYREDEE